MWFSIMERDAGVNSKGSPSEDELAGLGQGPPQRRQLLSERRAVGPPRQRQHRDHVRGLLRSHHRRVPTTPTAPCRGAWPNDETSARLPPFPPKTGSIGIPPCADP